MQSACTSRHRRRRLCLCCTPTGGPVRLGATEVIVAGVSHKAALFVLSQPPSNPRFGYLFPRECPETSHEGHARAFAFFGGLPSRISYDNTPIAARKLVGLHDRQPASHSSACSRISASPANSAGCGRPKRRATSRTALAPCAAQLSGAGARAHS